MEIKHTPTPWKLDKRHIGHISTNTEDEIAIANAILRYSSIEFAEAQANAEFIVKACNAHDILVGSFENNWQHCRGAIKLAVEELKQLYGYDGNRTAHQAEVFFVLFQALVILDSSMKEYKEILGGEQKK